MSTSVTMKDVAREAGVSLATVSKVMNGVGNVDADLGDRVREAASRLGYRKNYIARMLKTSKTNHVHIILPNMDDPNFRGIYAGAEQILNDRGYLVSLHLTSDIRSRENLFLDAALQHLAAGVILATCQPEDGTRVEELENSGAKLVFVEREPAHGDYTYLDFDNRKLIHGATRKLLEGGCRDIVLLAGPREYSSEFRAVKGFGDAMADADEMGIDASGSILEANLDLESAFQAMVTHLHSGRRPDAVVTTSMVTYKSARKAIEFIGQPTPRTAGRKPGSVDDASLTIYGGRGRDPDFKGQLLPKPVKFVTLGHAGWADDIPDQTEVISLNSFQMGEDAARALMANLENPLANSGRYYCVETPAAARRERHAVSRRIYTGGRSRLRILLQLNSSPSIKPLLADFENRFGCASDIDLFYYDDMFDFFDNPGRLEKYDILQLDQPVIAELAARGILERLNGMVDRLPDLPDIRADHPTAASDVYSWHDGGLYAVPFRFGSQLLFYRTDLFDNPEIRRQFRHATGSDLRPPRTWLEYTAVAKFFTRALNPDSPVEFGSATGAHHYVGAVSEFIPRLWSFGGSVLDARKDIALDSRQAVDALRSFLDSIACSPPGADDFWQNAQIRIFNTGRVAMMTIFSAMAEHLVQRQESHVVGKIGYARVPGDTPLLGGWSLGIRKGSPNLDLAVEWIRWITSDRMAIPHTILGGANMAAMLRQNTELRSIYPWLSTTLDSFRISRPHEVSCVTTDGRLRYRDFAIILSHCIHQAIAGEIGPEEAIEKAARLLRRPPDDIAAVCMPTRDTELLTRYRV